LDLRECLRDTQRLRIGDQLEWGNVVDRLRSGPFEEGMDRHVQRFGDLHQAAGADAVRALLVFLNLLEGDPKLIGERGLRHVLGEAPDPDVASDDDVGLMRSLFLHVRSPQFPHEPVYIIAISLHNLGEPSRPLCPLDRKMVEKPRFAREGANWPQADEA
jgi:hypothetical protein